MSNPPPPPLSIPSPANPENVLLHPVEYMMLTGTIETPQGTYGIITIRHPAGEVTAYVNRDAVQGWERQLHELAALISPSGLQVVRGTGGVGGIGGVGLPGPPGR